MSWSTGTDWDQWDPEKILTCPYDPAHQIMAKRFQNHLVKCRKNHPDKDFVTCPFNASHVILRPDLRHHISQCKFRNVVDADIALDNEKNQAGYHFKGNTSVPSYATSLPEPEEDWDQDDDSNNEESSSVQTERDNLYHQCLTDSNSFTSEERINMKHMMKKNALMASRSSNNHHSVRVVEDDEPTPNWGRNNRNQQRMFRGAGNSAENIHSQDDNVRNNSSVNTRTLSSSVSSNIHNPMPGPSRKLVNSELTNQDDVQRWDDAQRRDDIQRGAQRGEGAQRMEDTVGNEKMHGYNLLSREPNMKSEHYHKTFCIGDDNNFMDSSSLQNEHRNGNRQASQQLDGSRINEMPHNHTIVHCATQPRLASSNDLGQCRIRNSYSQPVLNNTNNSHSQHVNRGLPCTRNTIGRGLGLLKSARVNNVPGLMQTQIPQPGSQQSCQNATNQNTLAKQPSIGRSLVNNEWKR